MTQAAWTRIRRGALWLLFPVVLLIPKILALRRRSPMWNALRAIFAIAGIGMASLALTNHISVPTGALGVLMLSAALIFPPEGPRMSVDARAKELGALIAVQGGSYRATAEGKNSEPVSQAHTRLFVGSERLWILDPTLRTLAEIPLAQVTLLRAERADGAWKLRVEWSDSAGEFLYRGPFAEHFARVAESTVRSQLSIALPVLP